MRPQRGNFHRVFQRGRFRVSGSGRDCIGQVWRETEIPDGLWFKSGEVTTGGGLATSWVGAGRQRDGKTLRTECEWWMPSTMGF